MTQSLLPDNDLTESITPDIRRKHRWDYLNEKRIAGTEFADGNGRTIRDCIFCGMKKVTVHPVFGNPWREWVRLKAPEIYFMAEATPLCGSDS